MTDPTPDTEELRVISDLDSRAGKPVGNALRAAADALDAARVDIARLEGWYLSARGVAEQAQAEVARLRRTIEAVEALISYWFECGSGEFHYADAAMELHAALNGDGRD